MLTLLVALFALAALVFGLDAGEAQPLSVPTRTWIARPLPEFGKGPCPAALGCKHMRLASNPVNGRIYFLGGDYSGPDAMESARNELYSYSVATGDWRLEYPYCGYPGDIMPGRPDEIGWVWDSKRHVFWVIPGGLYLIQSGNGGCTGGAQQVGTGLFTFDPVTRKFTQSSIRNLDRQGEDSPKYYVYDPVKDQVIGFRNSGGRGNVADVLDLSTGQWSIVQFSTASDGTPINNALLGSEYMAIDPVGRYIYAITPGYFSLLRYHLDDRRANPDPLPPGYVRKWIAVVDILPAPPNVLNTNDHWNFMLPVWDSKNRVLLFPYIRSLVDARPALLIYRPESRTWERDAMHQPDGLSVRGNSAVFDAVHNVLLVIGGLGEQGGADRTLRHFFLYRYADGPEARKGAGDGK